MSKILKNKIAIAIFAALFSAYASAKPTIYGKIDLSVDYLPQDNATQKDQDKFRVNSNNSLIGLKGEEKINDRLSAVYQSEWLIVLDTNRNGSETFTPRSQFIGIKDSKLGSIKLGKQDSPLKQLGVIVDSYNNSVENNADIQGVMGGDNRVDNSILYESPSFAVAEGKIDFALMLPRAEQKYIEKSKGGGKAAGRGIGESFSSSLLYSDKMYSVGLGYDHAIPTNFLRKAYLNTSDTETDTSSAYAAANTVRAIGRVNLDNGLSLRGLYQNAEVENKPGNSKNAQNIDDANSWLLGAEYTLPQAKKWTVKAQYTETQVSMKNGLDHRNISQIIGGADYAFSKKVRAYGYAGYLSLEQGHKEDHQLLIGSGVEWKF